MQVHTVHKQAGDMDVGLGHPPFRFGQMPHDLKRRRKKKCLTFTLVGKPGHLTTSSFIKHMADNQAQNDTPEARAHQ